MKTNTKVSKFVKEPLSEVQREKLSDGSVAHNVVVTIDGQYRKICFACETAEHADYLSTCINSCSWVEVIENGRL